MFLTNSTIIISLLIILSCTNATDTFECLVDLNAGELEGINVAMCENGFSDTFLLVPVVDGDFIVERPVETILKGRLNAVSIPCYWDSK